MTFGRIPSRAESDSIAVSYSPAIVPRGPEMRWRSSLHDELRREEPAGKARRRLRNPVQRPVEPAPVAREDPPGSHCNGRIAVPKR